MMEMVENCWAEIAASMSERTYRPIPNATIQIETTDAHSAPATNRVRRDCHEGLFTAGSPPGLFPFALHSSPAATAGIQGITDAFAKG